MSGLPYRFEPGMRVNEDLVVGTDKHEPSVQLSRGGWIFASDAVADLDHPGTRGLLLQQYREASGHEHACVSVYHDVDEDDDRYDESPDWFEGPWGVEVNDGNTPRQIVGEGESEGAAILDALTRLAAERARESEQAKSAEGSEAIAQAMFTELLSAMDGLVERLAAVESRLSAMESGRGGRTIVLSQPADPDNTEGP